MASKIVVLLFSLLTWSFPSFENFETKPTGLYGSKAYPAYFDGFEEEEIIPLLLNTEGLTKKSFDPVIGSTQVNDPIVINVDDYGALGDGADDTMVSTINVLLIVLTDIHSFSFHNFYILRHFRRHGKQHAPPRAQLLWWRQITRLTSLNL